MTFSNNVVIFAGLKMVIVKVHIIISRERFASSVNIGFRKKKYYYAPSYESITCKTLILVENPRTLLLGSAVRDMSIGSFLEISIQFLGWLQAAVLSGTIWRTFFNWINYVASSVASSIEFLLKLPVSHNLVCSDLNILAHWITLLDVSPGKFPFSISIC